MDTRKIIRYFFNINLVFSILSAYTVYFMRYTQILCYKTILIKSSGFLHHSCIRRRLSKNSGLLAKRNSFSCVWIVDDFHGIVFRRKDVHGTVNIYVLQAHVADCKNGIAQYQLTVVCIIWIDCDLCLRTDFKIRSARS